LIYVVAIEGCIISSSSTFNIHLKDLCDIVDAFDRWCGRLILRLSYLQRVTNEEVMRTTTILRAMQVGLIQDARLGYFVMSPDCTVQRTTAMQSLLF